MRGVTLFAVLLAAAAAGCGKQPSANSSGEKHVSSFGDNPTNPNQGENLSVAGGQGAIQAPRMAAARTVNQVQLDQIYKSMFFTFQLDNRVPSKDEIEKEARQNPQLWPLIKEEVIILTGTARGDGVWAYTQYPQRGGDHYVVTQSGVQQMVPEELRRRLEQQMSEIKMAK